MCTESTPSNTTIMNGKQPITALKSFNVNDEYFSTLRTKSCAEFLSKAHSLIKKHPSEPSEIIILLEPHQESITSFLESPFLTKFPQLKTLLIHYFDITEKVSKFCTHLLQNVKNTQSNSHLFQQSLDKSFKSFPSLETMENPFNSGSDAGDFQLIHGRCSSVSGRLNCMRKKVTRKIRFIGIFDNGLREVREKLEAAAKGTYIMKRDLDTVSRLVVRVEDAIEHSRAMVRLCREMKKEEKFGVQMVEELKKNNFSVGKQVKELEEHLFLCLVTINRTRALVVQEKALGK